MSIQTQNLVYVYYHGSAHKLLKGRLLLKNRQIFFEYDASFILERRNTPAFMQGM